jgi:hypothetical protein
MTIEGRWKLKTQTPLGQRKSELRLVTAGTALTGEQSAEGESGPLLVTTLTGWMCGKSEKWPACIVTYRASRGRLVEVSRTHAPR